MAKADNGIVVHRDWSKARELQVRPPPAPLPPSAGLEAGMGLAQWRLLLGGGVPRWLCSALNEQH